MALPVWVQRTLDYEIKVAQEVAWAVVTAVAVFVVQFTIQHESPHTLVEWKVDLLALAAGCARITLVTLMQNAKKFFSGIYNTG